MMEKGKEVSSTQLRSFGLIVSGIFSVIAFWSTLFHGEDARKWALIVSVLLAVAASVRPTSLRPLYKVWMRVGSALGWVNTRIILSLGFYGVFSPMGIIMRLFGKDPLRREFDPDVTTYRVARSPRSGSHMQKQF